MQTNIIKIAITGPESTGKSQLARELAEHYKTKWVEEYARSYISNLNRNYNYDDILIIARKQIENENFLINKANKYLFCDTDITVCKIWCDYKYHKCHQWIENKFKNHIYDLYLLCDIDLPWEYDPQRENQNDRIELFNYFKKTLESSNFPYVIINGSQMQRSINAINVIDNYFKKV